MKFHFNQTKIPKWSKASLQAASRAGYSHFFYMFPKLPRNDMFRPRKENGAPRYEINRYWRVIFCDLRQPFYYIANGRFHLCPLTQESNSRFFPEITRFYLIYNCSYFENSSKPRNFHNIIIGICLDFYHFYSKSHSQTHTEPILQNWEIAEEWVSNRRHFVPEIRRPNPS